MTDNIDDIVSVQISRETDAVAQESFGIAMILGTHKVFNERLKYFNALSEVASAGFSTSSKEYLAAQKLFGQTPRVDTIAIGRRSVDDATVVVSTVSDTALYTVTINGVACSYQAESGDLINDIGEGLEAAINAASTSNSWGLTAVNTAGTIVITQAVADTAWTLSVGQRLTINTLVASADIDADLDAIQIYQSNWYGLIITSRTDQDILDTAAWVEANKKIFGTASADPNVLSSASTTDIAYLLQQANYDRTFILYHQDAATVYPEAAWFGVGFPLNPGASTWAFKTLEGINVSTLTSDQRANVMAKKANTFESRGGVAITMEGWMVSGEYIDVIRDLDWLESTIQANVFNRLVNLPKIPYTDAGVTIVESEVRRSLDLAVVRGVLAADPAYTVTAPLVADISPQDKATRNLPDVNFTATLANAIHHVQIFGTVTA